MRSFYPVNSQESKNEMNEIQEHLMTLIGYDSNPHDDVIDKKGTLDTYEDNLDASGMIMMNERIFNENSYYKQAYQANLIYHIRRRTHGG